MGECEIYLTYYNIITKLFREIFHEERRDWEWWESVRQYVYMNGDSWYGCFLKQMCMTYVKILCLCKN